MTNICLRAQNNTYWTPVSAKAYLWTPPSGIGKQVNLNTCPPPLIIFVFLVVGLVVVVFLVLVVGLVVACDSFSFLSKTDT